MAKFKEAAAPPPPAPVEAAAPPQEPAYTGPLKWRVLADKTVSLEGMGIHNIKEGTLIDISSYGLPHFRALQNQKVKMEPVVE